jgi:hypothetical protein
LRTVIFSGLLNTSLIMVYYLFFLCSYFSDETQKILNFLSLKKIEGKSLKHELKVRLNALPKYPNKFNKYK